MLGLEDRRGDVFPQFLVAENRHAAVLIGIFQPVETGFVAGAAHLQRVRPGIVFARGVDHEIHVVSDTLAHDPYVSNLAFDGGVAPTVNLERPISHVPALFGEISKGFGSVQSTVFVPMVGTGVSGQGHSVTTQQLVNRRIVVLAREVP